jgi:hypothetical protein
MTTLAKIYNDSDYLQAHLTVLDGPGTLIRSFKGWGRRAFTLLLAVLGFYADHRF